VAKKKKPEETEKIEAAPLASSTGKKPSPLLGRLKTDYGIDRDAFIIMWEEGDDLEDTYQRMVEYCVSRNMPPIPKAIMCARASYYRQEGYRVKKHPPGRKKPANDVTKVNRMIAEIRARKLAGGSTPIPPATPLAAPPESPPQHKVVEGLKEALGEQKKGSHSLPTPGPAPRPTSKSEAPAAGSKSGSDATTVGKADGSEASKGPAYTQQQALDILRRLGSANPKNS
jgi:hypothetical protein